MWRLHLYCLSCFSKQRLYVTCREVQTSMNTFFSKTSTCNLQCCRWHKFTIKALLCDAQYFYTITQQQHTQNALLFPRNGSANAPQYYIVRTLPSLLISTLRVGEFLLSRPGHSLGRGFLCPTGDRVDSDSSSEVEKKKAF